MTAVSPRKSEGRPRCRSARRSSEVLDPEEFLPFQLWFDGCVWKLQTAGVPSTEHTRLVCQKLAGAALATFKSKCMAEHWDLSACEMPLLRKRIFALFPNAEAILTRKLNSMTFRVKHLSQDLMTFRHYARHSSFAQMLDHNEFLYTLVRNKLHAVRSNCLIAVQSEYGLCLDKNEPFDNFINQAVQIAQKVQASSVLTDEPSDEPASKRAKPEAKSAKATTAKKPGAGGAGASGSNKSTSTVTHIIEEPWMAAARKKVRSGADPAWSKRMHTENPDDNAFLRALGCCPDCGFMPSVKHSLCPHGCFVDKREGVSLCTGLCARRVPL